MKAMNISYLECKKSGFHSGQQLNIVCMNPACVQKDTILCCCACIEEFHHGHQTKTLKKLLIQAEDLAQKPNQPENSKINPKINTAVILEMVNCCQSECLDKFGKLRHEFIQTLDQIENNLMKYYDVLINQLKESLGLGSKSYNSQQIKETISNIQNSSDQNKLVQNLQGLIKSINIANSGPLSQSFIPPDQTALTNFINNSNKEIIDTLSIQIQELAKKLSQTNQFYKKIIPKISDIRQKQIYKFSNEAKHKGVKIVGDYVAFAEEQSIYQIAMMEPKVCLSSEGIESFRFKINKLDLEWVGIGVCRKSIAQKSNYEFQFNELGHGCFLISGNGGTWSSQDANWNNIVSSFKFKEGDSITCILTKSSIHFIKDIPLQHTFSQQYSQRQYMELQFNPNIFTDLHPCVVSFYRNTQVQYLPSISSVASLHDIPRYQYKYSEQFHHSGLKLINSSSAISIQDVTYMAALLHKSIQEHKDIAQVHKFCFRIVNSSGWVAVGICHQKLLESKAYHVGLEELGHGSYLLSSNGGSWSHFDNNCNNIVRAFKFVSGDLIECSVHFGVKNTITFKKGVEKYTLQFKTIPGDKLYPCSVFYYNNDEISIMPVIA